ncbi:hypothetical protein Tco_0290282 [Tanacetum coccineum]
MNSTKASSSNPSKKIKLTIIPPRQLFVNISSDEDVTTTPSPTITSSSSTPPNAPSKTISTNQTSSSQGNISSSFQSKLQISPPSSNEPTSPHPLNPLLDNILDVPPRPLNPQPLLSHPSLDITLFLSPITPLDHIHDTLSPPSPPQPQPPIMGHPLYYNYHDYHGSNCIFSVFLMPGQISSGLVPNPVPAAPYVPPTNKDLEILFQPMFDEYLEPPRVERPVSPAPAVQVPVNSTSTPSYTTIDQDAPSPTHSPSSSTLQSLSLHQAVAAESTLIEDNPFAPIDNDHFINMFALETRSEASSSGDLSSTESLYVSQTLHHLGRWSKDNPLDNIIGNPSRPKYHQK